MAALLLSQYINVKEERKDLHQFLLSNGIFAIASGIAVGISSYELIRICSVDLIMPLLNKLMFGLLELFNKKLANKLSYSLFTNIEFNFQNVFQSIILWVIFLLVTYFLMDKVVKNISTNSLPTLHSETP